MDTTIGTTETSLLIATAATTNEQFLYYTKFVSPLLNMTAISANTWHYAIGATESNAAANFPRSGAGALYVSCYVWKPSNGTSYGAILDGNSNADGAETTTTERAIMCTFTGAGVGSLTAGDAVIVVEIWARVTQGGATSRNDTFHYDGVDEPSTTGVSVLGDVAAFIRTPETLVFGGAPPAAADEERYMGINTFPRLGFPPHMDDLLSKIGGSRTNIRTMELLHQLYNLYPYTKLLPRSYVKQLLHDPCSHQVQALLQRLRLLTRDQIQKTQGMSALMTPMVVRRSFQQTLPSQIIRHF